MSSNEIFLFLICNVHCRSSNLSMCVGRSHLTWYNFLLNSTHSHTDTCILFVINPGAHKTLMNWNKLNKKPKFNYIFFGFLLVIYLTLNWLFPPAFQHYKWYTTEAKSRPSNSKHMCHGILKFSLMWYCKYIFCYFQFLCWAEYGNHNLINHSFRFRKGAFKKFL